VFANDTDIDTNDALFATLVSADGAFGHVLLTPDGWYTYTLDNANPVVDALDAGQTLVESFDYRAADLAFENDVAQITITIQGVTDDE
jgi:VCBS repeat-containing protein